MRHVILAIALGSLVSVAPVAANNEPATATAAPAADPDQKIKCRKIEVTGSIVKKGKVCRTLAEWRATQESHNSAARRMVEDNTGRPSGQ